MPAAPARRAPSAGSPQRAAAPAAAAPWQAHLDGLEAKVLGIGVWNLLHDRNCLWGGPPPKLSIHQVCHGCEISALTPVQMPPGRLWVLLQGLAQQ